MTQGSAIKLETDFVEVQRLHLHPNEFWVWQHFIASDGVQ